MAIHLKKHNILSQADHEPGTAANSNEVNLIGTNDSGYLIELTAEAPGVASTTSKVVRRSSSGHIAVPTSGQAAAEVLSRQQVEELVSSGVWRSPVHSLIPDHTLSSVGDMSLGGPSLEVGDLVINSTTQKIHKVLSVAGGTTGDKVSWDVGYIPTTQEVRIDKLTDNTITFDMDTQTWFSQGASSHSRQHSMISSSDHTAGLNKMFYSDNSGIVCEIPLTVKNSPLLSNGVNSPPTFGAMKIAPAVINSASADPIDNEVNSWDSDTFGVVRTTNGKMFFTFKDISDVYYVEMNSI